MWKQTSGFGGAGYAKAVGAELVGKSPSAAETSIVLDEKCDGSCVGASPDACKLSAACDKY